jgi:hypothetical protein
VPESTHLQLVKDVIERVTLGMNTIDNDVSAGEITRAVCTELLSEGVSLLAGKAAYAPLGFAIGLLLFPSGRVWRCLAPSGSGYVAAWQLADVTVEDPAPRRRSSTRLERSADRVLEATTVSAMNDKLDRVVSELAEARAAHERLLRVVVESAASRRRPWVVRVLGLAFHFAPEENHDGELQIPGRR